MSNDDRIFVGGIIVMFMLALLVGVLFASAQSVDDFINQTKTELLKQESQKAVDDELYQRMIDSGCIDPLYNPFMSSEEIRYHAVDCIERGMMK